MIYRYFIPIPPVAWKAHAGSGRKSFNPLWREKSAFRWKLGRLHQAPQGDGRLISGPVRIKFSFLMEIPKSFPKKKLALIQSGEKVYHVKRKDLTNCIKFAEDCLKGILIEDDNVVCSIVAEKYYSETPGTIIDLEEV